MEIFRRLGLADKATPTSSRRLSSDERADLREEWRSQAAAARSVAPRRFALYAARIVSTLAHPGGNVIGVLGSLGMIPRCQGAGAPFASKTL